MSVFDEFNEEYDYRVKYNREHPSKEQTNVQEQTESQIAQEEQQPVIPPRRRGRGR